MDLGRALQEQSIRHFKHIEVNTVTMENNTYVPVLPERTRGAWSISWEVPKSESIALGLEYELGRLFIYILGHETYINLSSPLVNRTFPSFRSK